jgi:hypothetical protein
VAWLRQLFVVVFFSHVSVALAFALGLRLIAGNEADNPNMPVAIVVAAGAMVQWFFALVFSLGSYRTIDTVRRRADDDTPPEISPARRLERLAGHGWFTAVMLSSPAWFLAFGFATGQPLVANAVATLFLALGYAMGQLQVGAAVRKALPSA